MGYNNPNPGSQEQPLTQPSQNIDTDDIKLYHISTSFNGIVHKDVSLPLHAPLDDVMKTQSHPDWRMRVAATKALARFGDSTPKHALTKALIDGHKAVRVAALETFAVLTYKVSVSLVEAALVDPEWSVQAAAARVLGYFGDRAPVKRLIAIVQDREEIPQVRASALDALRMLRRGISIELVTDTLYSTDELDWPVREIAVIILGTLGHQEKYNVVDLLVTILTHDPIPVVRAAAALSLQRIGKLSESALIALREATNDQDQTVRQVAHWALEEGAKHL